MLGNLQYFPVFDFFSMIIYFKMNPCGRTLSHHPITREERNLFPGLPFLFSTHSPILLATARQEDQEIRCTLLEEFNLRNSKLIKNFTDEELNEIGRVMGDNNFYAYFNISSPGNRAIFIEDERIETINAFKRNGFLISKGLKGITEIAKYLAVTTSNPEFIKTFTYFIIDNDNGSSYIKSYLDKSNLIKEKDGFKKFRLNAVPNVFIILLPEDLAAEGLFSEYSTHLDACVKKLWDSENNDWNKSIDRGLVRTCGEIKSQKILPPDCEGQIRKLIKNKQEVKDMFWKEVELKEWKFDKEHIKVLNEFLK